MCRKEEDMSSYSEGQTHQLMERLEVEGFTPDDVTKLGQYKDLSNIRGLFCGTHELKLVKHIIDCDADPFCPDGWKVEEHHKRGRLEWDVSKIQLYLSKGQKDGNWFEGNKLRKELTNKPVLNANVLDYLLKNPYLIPEEWRSKVVFFWGTIYRVDGRLVVRFLYWLGEWDWYYYWLGNDFRDYSPAVLLAS
jgi:hypothetical protein